MVAESSVASVDHGRDDLDESSFVDRGEEVLNHFVRRMENRGWDSSAVRESLVGGASDVTDVWLAMKRVYGLGVKETALMESPWLENALQMGIMEDWTTSVTIESLGSLDERDLSGGSLRKARAPRVWLKMENTQSTGSFKVRGACNALTAKLEEDAEARFVCSSTGNHALACIHAIGALRKQGARVPDEVLDIYLPGSVSKRKLAKIEREARLVGGVNVMVLNGVEDCVATEVLARREAAATGRHYVSPYNDTDIIAGQATIAMELLMELSPNQLDYVFVPVGGGGLICGIAKVIKKLAPGVKIVGCQAAASPVMMRSVEEGCIVEMEWEETLAEGLVGGIEAESCTFEGCKTLVDEWVTVSESEIARALVGVHGHHAQVIEGAAGATIAAIIKRCGSMRDKGVVGIVCGGNLSATLLDRAYDVARGAGEDHAGSSRASAF